MRGPMTFSMHIAPLMLILFVPGSGVPNELKTGAAAVRITPFGSNPEWDGTVTASGVWGEKFTDLNGNSRWDAGEPFEDDPLNSALDPSSSGKYDGIFLAGFGMSRIATAMHDDLWARTTIIEQGKTRIALVSIDLIGYYSRANYYGLQEIQKLLDPGDGITEVLISSTHSHEGPDTIGAWGSNPLSDGKYPRYLRFVDRQIARSIHQAVLNLTPARMKLGRTDAKMSPSIAGMQVRTGGRPPAFFDDELRVLQFVAGGGANKESTIATLINWNTHPESMESGNTVLTSDFPHAVRAAVEARYGGIAIYLTGDVGAAEIVGDTDNDAKDRIVFDGTNFPLADDKKRPVFTFERTEAIGRDVAKAVFEAIEHGEWSKSDTLIVRKAEMKVPMDNAGYMFLTSKGVLDAIPLPSDGSAPVVRTWIYAITLGDAQFITTPGELFPEIFYGVAKHRRSDCSSASTGRPYEPAVRERMAAKYRFVLGLCPDELGYLVPGYDFRPPRPVEGGLRRAEDPCKASGVTDHYHETNSASSMLAPAWACVAVKLLTGVEPREPACMPAK